MASPFASAKSGQVSTSVTWALPFTASAYNWLIFLILSDGRDLDAELGNTWHRMTGIFGLCRSSPARMSFRFAAMVSGSAFSSRSLVPMSRTTACGSSASTSSFRRMSTPREVSPLMPRLAIFTPGNQALKSSPQPWVIESPSNTTACLSRSTCAAHAVRRSSQSLRNQSARRIGPAPGRPLSVAGISNCVAEGLSCAHDVATTSRSDRMAGRQQPEDRDFMRRNSGKSRAQRKICERLRPMPREKARFFSGQISAPLPCEEGAVNTNVAHEHFEPFLQRVTGHLPVPDIFLLRERNAVWQRPRVALARHGAELVGHGQPLFVRGDDGGEQFAGE